MSQLLLNKRFRFLTTLVALITIVGTQFQMNVALPNVEAKQTDQLENANRSANLASLGGSGKLDATTAAAKAERQYLTFPNGKVPKDWRATAAEYIDKHVPVGQDFGQADKRGVQVPGLMLPDANSADAPNGATLQGNAAAATPSAVKPVSNVDWTSLGPAPVDGNAQQ